MDDATIRELIDLKVTARVTELVGEFNKLAGAFNALVTQTLPPLLEDYATRQQDAADATKNAEVAALKATIDSLNEQLAGSMANGIAEIEEARRERTG